MGARHGQMPPSLPSAGNAWSVLRVLHFGDSHTGSDSQQRVLKNGLHEKFGNGGTGYLMPWLQRRGDPKIGATPGWRRVTLSPRTSDVLVGLKGTAVEAYRRGERTWFEGSFSRMRLYLLRLPGGGNLRVTVDGQPLGDQSLAASSPDVLVVEKAFGDAGATHRLQIETVGDGRCRILGLALEGSTGASYSPLGLNGAQASWLLRLPEPILETQLRREAPNLIVLAFGTNEAIGREFDAASYERTLKQLLARIHRCVPLASLLLVAPPDAAFPRGGASALARVSAIQRAQAGAQGAGFVDLRVTMGGSGSIQLWRATGLAQPDLIHFTPPGYTRHGQNILAAMLQGLEGTPRSSGTTADLRSQPPPKVNPIYVFRTRDGRTLITDTPSSVEGLVGQWVGQKPGMKP